MATAGELIRNAVNDGETMLGLAKRLAGTTEDTDPEVRRWFNVVRRASFGSEPQSSNRPRIEAVFGIESDRPTRTRSDRLAELEAVVEKMREDLKAVADAMMKGQRDARTGQIETQREARRLFGDIQEMLDERLPDPQAKTSRQRKTS